MPPAKHDYSYLVIDAFSEVRAAFTAIMAAHCSRCLYTFTAVSTNRKTCLPLIKRKFRDHEGQFCEQKADRLAESVQAARAQRLRSAKQAVSGREI